MTSRRWTLLVALAGALLASGARAQMPLPPSIAQGGMGVAAPAATKPTSKPRPKAAKPAEAATPGAAPARAAVRPAGSTTPARSAARPAPQRGYSETLPLPRRIDRSEIDDPYGSSTTDPFGNRMRPSITPSGGMGMGGQF